MCFISSCGFRKYRSSSRYFLTPNWKYIWLPQVVRKIMLLNAIPSLYVNSNLVRSGCFEWSSSDEEIPKDSVNARERLRGGGSKFKLTTTRHKPSNPTRRESCRRTDDKELRIRDPKSKTFAKLKTKLSTAKQAMFRKKKGDTDVTTRGDRSTNISVADVCER
jgi:hypothetical protein